MSGHLEADRIARCMLDEASAGDREHLARCAVCRLEVEEFGQTLRAFRGSVREWSQCELGACDSGPKWVGRSALSTACCVAVPFLLCLTGLAVSLQQRANRPPTGIGADADSVLLEQVRADVARRVPDGMEPLLNLMSSPRDSRLEDVADEPLP